MNSRNTQDNGAAFMMAGAAIVFIFLFVFFAFVSFCLTILSLFALRRPLTIGSMTITPAEAKGFIGCGIVGAIVAPPMIVLMFAMLGTRPDLDPGLLAIAGYTIGSLGFAAYCAKKEEAEEEARRNAPPPAPVQRRPVARQATESKEPFRFASWDDDGEVGR